MSIPGLFVEYLVTGSVALIWLIPILLFFNPSLSKADSVVLLLAPGLYVLGMMIDHLGWLFTRRYKKRILRQINDEYGVHKEQIRGLSARLAIHAPELARNQEMYSSRDRVARGAWLNITIITLVFSCYFIYEGQIRNAVSIFLLGIAIVFFCLHLWQQHQYTTYRHEVYSFRALNEKLNDSSPKIIVPDK